MTCRLTVVATHPVQYQAPLFRRLAQEKDLDLHVFYCQEHGGIGPSYDPEFGLEFEWDIPLLEGYKYSFVQNRAPRWVINQSYGLLNPSIGDQIEAHGSDVVLIHTSYWAPTSWFALRAARRLRKPTLYRAETVLRPDRNSLIKACKRLILRRFLKEIDAYLTIGKQSAKFYRSFGVSSERMFFTPYSVDNDFFITATDRARRNRHKTLGTLNLDGGQPVILFVGKLVDRKRPGDLLRALARMQHSASLVFVGDGELRSVLQSQARTMDLEVGFAGFQNQREIPQWYAAADVFVLPSDQEVSPLAINEAMASRLPVVVSDAIPSAPEFVDHGVNGFVYSVGDVARLAELLDRLVSDRDFRETMGERSRERIRRWSFDACVEGILDAVAFVTREDQGASIS